MSNWVHIACIIRCNYKDKKEIYDIIGKPITFDDLMDRGRLIFANPLKYTKLPLGSEGTLEVSIHQGEFNFAASTTISIYGDLRDPETIKYGMPHITYYMNWFDNCCKELDPRNAVIQIIDESKKEPYIKSYEGF